MKKRCLAKKGVSWRETFGVAMVVGAAISFAGLLALATPAQGAAKLTFAQTRTSLFTHAVYVAIEEGYFRDEGIELKMFEAGGGPQAVRALAAHQANVSVQDPALCETARQKGAKIKSIGAAVTRLATYVVGKKDIDVQNIDAWKGRKMAILQRPNNGAAVLDLVLTKAGWKQKPRNTYTSPKGGAPVQMIEVKMGHVFPALLSGAVDMGVGFEPGASNAIVAGKNYHLIWSFSKAFGEFQFGTYCARDDDIASMPDRLQAFMNGIAHSLKFMRENREKSLAHAYKWFPKLNKRAVQMAFDRFVQENVYPPRLTISQKAWKANFDNFLPFVNYPLKLPVKMEDVTYLEFAKKADKKFGLDK